MGRRADNPITAVPSHRPCSHNEEVNTVALPQVEVPRKQKSTDESFPNMDSGFTVPSLSELPNDPSGSQPANDVAEARHRQLDYIDGLRALAALYIVVHHVLLTTKNPVAPTLSLRFFSHGYEVVAMFLTISGFCLTLPQAEGGKWRLDSARFIRRRARRILPPYYAACAVALGAGFLQMHWGHSLTGTSLVAHALLLQNWVPSAMYTLDGPLWSVALECQIYFLFPLVVLARRCSGAWLTLLLTVIVGLISSRLLHGRGQTIFLAYFGLGVFFAEAAFRKPWRSWLPLCAAATLCRDPRHDVSAGLWAICVGSLMAHLATARRHPLRRILGCKPLASIGLFSYSIYLLHSLFTESTFWYMHSKNAAFGTSNDLHHILVMSFAAFVSLPIAYLFHRVAEAPFMGQKRTAFENGLWRKQRRSEPLLPELSALP